MFLPQFQLTELEQFVEVITEDGGVSALVGSGLAGELRHGTGALFQQPGFLRRIQFIRANAHHSRDGRMVQISCLEDKVRVG